MGLFRRVVMGPKRRKGFVMTRRMWLVVIAYVVIGVIVASSHHYFAHLDGLKQLASALFAVLLWPLVLIGVNLRIK